MQCHAMCVLYATQSERFRLNPVVEVVLSALQSRVACGNEAKDTHATDRYITDFQMYINLSIHEARME